jgi:hypothetical protein
MTSKEFVIWLKGFTEGVHEYNITPKQWDLLKLKLEEISDESQIGFPFGVPNSAPIVTLPHITPGPSTNPYKPYEVYCGDKNGTTPGFAITTTPGTGYITTYNPAQFGTGSLTTSTTMFQISGSNVTYTNGGNDIKD